MKIFVMNKSLFQCQEIFKEEKILTHHDAENEKLRKEENEELRNEENQKLRKENEQQKKKK